MNLTAACGANCAECPVYVATVRNDGELRRLAAEKCRTEWNIQAQPEEINCLGCRSDVVFGYCQICEIRSCPETQSIERCHDCATYPCDRIRQFRAREKARLDELHRVIDSSK